jgi:hypothetical protein
MAIPYDTTLYNEDAMSNNAFGKLNLSLSKFSPIKAVEFFYNKF